MNHLSKRQFALLKVFAEGSAYLSIANAQQFDQRPFRSMLYQRCVAYRPGKGFHVTHEGMNAWNEFRHVSLARKNPTLPLTRYFDPIAYGLKDPYRKKARVHLMQRGQAA